MVIFVSILLAITLFVTLEKQTGSKIVSLGIAVIVMIVAHRYINCRAQIISYLLFALEIFYIDKLMNTNKKRYIFLLCLVSVLLLCFHSTVWLVYFIFFIPYIIEYIFNIFNKKSIFKNSIIIEKRSIRYMLITIIISMLIGFCTPLGIVPFIYMFSVMKGVSSKCIEELQPLMPQEYIGLIVIISFIFVLITQTKIKIKLVDLLIVLGMVIMSFMARRNLYIAVFVIALPISKILVECIEQTKLSNQIKKIEECIDGNIRIQIAITSIFCLLCVSFFVVKQRQEYMDKTLYPVEAVEYIKDNLNINEIRLYNAFNYGSYIEFQKIPAFIDSRSEIFTREFNNVDILEDWYKCELLGTVEISNLETKYKITHFLVYNVESNITNQLNESERYMKIYEDKYFMIYQVNN